MARPDVEDLPRLRRRALVWRALLRPLLGATGPAAACDLLPDDLPHGATTGVAPILELLVVSGPLVTVFSPVGFDDMAPKTGAARSATAPHLPGDSLLVGVVARVGSAAGRRFGNPGGGR